MHYDTYNFLLAYGSVTLYSCKFESGKFKNNLVAAADAMHVRPKYFRVHC